MAISSSDRVAEGADRREDGRRWLARHARTVIRLLEGGPPRAWSDPVFRREVDEVRTGLRPIRSRGALAASFARESTVIARPLRPSPAAEGPVPVAYAIRWHELGDGGRRRRRSDATAA